MLNFNKESESIISLKILTLQKVLNLSKVDLYRHFESIRIKSQCSFGHVDFAAYITHIALSNSVLCGVLNNFSV